MEQHLHLSHEIKSQVTECLGMVTISSSDSGTNRLQIDPCWDERGSVASVTGKFAYLKLQMNRLAQDFGPCCLLGLDPFTCS